MISRRGLLIGIGAGLATSHGLPAYAHTETFKLDEKFEPQTIRFSGYEPGTIIIDPKNHFLYLQLAASTARRYGVGVGRAGLAFKGQAKVGRKAKWPSWTPTANMIRRDPKKYARFAKGVPGGPNNPLGSRALYLYRDGRDTLYRIHGTTEPSSIGRSVSNGCIRMINNHVEDLFERVPVGAQVVVL
ncbi:MAG: L,D-transpeptidase [Hoeflea sp.]|uniref:L,D-transpeptidase n=1 Tax=Hoeflea sp. TaxID=1940281 RepID=UPI001DB5CA82|nr:L,D-transpeptidase [Hoeflea sp.]MBU4529326.1 L,D-transpeptidase [Alphaproteobacteria bacterium]MBU4545493.1 L,D-transpeptidase [Alphaproteobacteria bacterium]MBU4550208.1 L,D-transpeptidase [Alphaproteobacteria bacterium]MBV1723249.1 L,D-transpeptidase [Hoeflea sp.]MBV1782922.1 L,D-transpeptidase [Hoeflea sp.]